MSPALVKDRLVSGVTPPVVPENVTVPVPATKVRGSAPSRVLLKVILPLLAEVVIMLLPVRLTAAGKFKVASFVTVIFAPI